MKKCLATVSLLLLLTACATPSATPNPADPLQKAIERASLHREEISTGSFILTSYSRITDRDAPVTIYIEGEDKPYATSAAIEPTPQNPIGLRLATLDPAANVVYIARPCQFTSFDPACAPDLIQNGRFSAQTVTSVNRVINHAVIVLNHPRIHLVGYGSGGAIAALITAKRQQQADVISLRTVAANLDPEGLTRYMGYDGADDLIDPMPIAKKLVSIPQEHFVGADDTVIPPYLVSNFITQEHAHGCAIMTTLPAVSHNQGWEQVWLHHVRDSPRCGKTSGS